MDEIIGEFVVESLEGLDRLDQALVFLEETPDDSETITEVFRILHTIKGTCGFLAFTHLETVAHRGENLLSLLRDSVLEMDSEIANALLATVDAIRDLLATIEQTGEEGSPDNTALIAELERLSTNANPAEHTSSDKPDEQPIEENQANPELSEAAEDPPPSAPERIGDLLVDSEVAVRDDVEIAAAEQALGDDRRLGKILVDDGRAKQDDVERAVAAQSSSAADSTIRVDVALLDQLMNLVGELVLSRNQIIQLAESGDNRDFGGPAQRLNHITTELQEGVMKTRMQPIGNVWGKLPRVVRDLSRQFGKQIRLEMEGKDTELDRTIIEAIKDPLTHMVRNTADHGIEDAETRLAAGKQAEGVLRLRANHEGGQVTIQIIDDGAGIDAEAVRRKAVEKDVLSAEAAAAMTDTEAVQLIFAPGFSTASKVSNVSGRGVGMDVVKSNIERIGGSVEINTVKGQGTTFKIKIPLTLAIIPALTVLSGSNRYAIPQMSLVELLRLEGDDPSNRIESIHGAPVYRLRGRLLPIVYLHNQLEMTSLNGQEVPTVTNVVVLQADDRLFGLVVDEIEDTEEIVVKPLGREVQHISLFSGATIMGDGAVCLILDVLGLATEANILNAGSRGVDSHVEQEQPLPTNNDENQTLLLVGVSEEVEVAISLDDIERLEEFASNEIEESDHRPVVQYGGGVMPLHSVADLVGHRGSAQTSDRLSVVVCTRGDDSIGFVVERVLDIVANVPIQPGVGDGPKTALIRGNVVDVADLAGFVNRIVPPVPTLVSANR